MKSNLAWANCVLISRLYLANDYLAIVRRLGKSLIPSSFVRLFDSLRISTKVREVGRRERWFLKQALRNSQSATAFAQQVLQDFHQYGVRPDPEQIQVIADRSLGYAESLALYSSLFSRGLIVESSTFRIRAREQLLDIGRSLKENIPVQMLGKICGAGIEAGWTEENFRNNLGFAPECCLPPRLAADKSISKASLGQSDPGFYDDIRGKRVLVVGPGIDEGGLSHLDHCSFEVLVTTNYLGESHPIHSFLAFAMQTSRKTVSYYNNFNSKKMFYRPELRPNPEPDWSIYRRLAYSFQGSQLLRSKARVLRVNQGLVDGSWLALPALLYDLAHFEPASLYVTGFNFYLSNSPHAPGYSTKADTLTEDLSRHDPVGNFLYTKRLCEQGKFTADSTLKSVLDLSLDQYMEQLDITLSAN